MNYKGLFSPKNPHKYKGDPTKIVYRSYWELATMFFFDEQEAVVTWSSEEIFIPYRCPLNQNKIRKYCPDFAVTFSNGNKFIIEIKPFVQTIAPKQSKRKTKYLKESAVFLKNKEKWKAANRWADKYGYKFLIWTERELEKMGIYKKVR